ncbi:MAG: 4-alpha-glucanotransferase [Candidatus Melainabacteria bacterium]|nr:MAG: 4-alpha-glucanotransferase [Candidatus Melainabacteria bacterium]
MQHLQGKKLAGVLVPAFALRRVGDLGIGDTQAVKESIEFCARNQIGVLQLLPVNETGGDNSPYNAVSAIALDPALLTIAPNTVPGLTEESFHQLATPDVLQKAGAASIDYPFVKKLKLDLLRLAFANFLAEAQANSPANRAFAAFQKDNQDWLASYALFRALVDEQGGNTTWTLWDKPLQKPETARQWLLDSQHSARLKNDIEFWSYVQWLASRQWDEVRACADAAHIALMGDIPFGVSRYSADVWANQALFDLSWCGGAPPEKFFQGDEFTRTWGQNWGIPLYNWQAHKQEGFTWWQSRIAHTVRYFHYFRIDHVLGFFRIYAFPWQPEKNQEFTHLSEAQAKALTGGRLPKFIAGDDSTPASALANEAQGKELLTTIIEAAGSARVIAEDLGVIPNYVRPLLKQLGIPGFSIPIFERQPDYNFKPKETFPPLNLCTYGTHDHEPLASYYEHLVSWWHGPDGDNGWREVQRLAKFLSLDANQAPTEYTQSLQFAFFKALLQSPCWLAVLMITDLLGTKQRFNEPGLAGDYNWSQRLDKPLDQYEIDDRYANKISYFKQLIIETDRAISPELVRMQQRAANPKEMKN